MGAFRVRKTPLRDVTEQAIELFEGLGPYCNTIIDDFHYRSRIGLERYGTTLKTNNGRDALIDVYEELLDAYVYAVQHLMETESDSDVSDDIPSLVNTIQDALTNCVAAILERRSMGILERERPLNSPLLPLEEK
jgi:hypothetical protein